MASTTWGSPWGGYYYAPGATGARGSDYGLTNYMGLPYGSGMTTSQYDASTGRYSSTPDPYGSTSGSSGSGLQMFSTPQYLSSDYYSTARSALGDPSSINYQSFASNVANTTPPAISAPGEDYYNSQRQALMNSLNEQYFGTLGTAQQAASGAATAGRLGSGVGTAELQAAAMTPFANAVQQGYADIGRQQQEAQFQASQANQQAMQDYYNRLSSAYQYDAANQLQAQLAGADQDFQMRQLAAKMAAGDVTGMNEAQMKALEQSVMYDEIMRKYYDAMMGRQLEYMQIPFPENATYATEGLYENFPSYMGWA